MKFCKVELHLSLFVFLQTTHLVVNNADKSAESYKGCMVQKYGIPIVSTSFVDVSVERGELVEPDDYLAVGKTAAEQFQTGKIIGTIICVLHHVHSRFLYVTRYLLHYYYFCHMIINIDASFHATERVTKAIPNANGMSAS